MNIVPAVKWHSKRLDFFFIREVMEKHSTLSLPIISIIYENLESKYTLGLL
jgi:hypothetical protein